MINFDNIYCSTQPPGLTIPLYKHQLAMIHKMERLEQEQSSEIENSIQHTKLGVNSDLTGYGKCHGKNTPIIMYDGSIKKVQDILVGDLLMGDNSTPRKVLSLARGYDKMYKIKQSIYGNDYIVNESHILSLKIIKTKYIIYSDFYQAYYFDRDSITFLCKIFTCKRYGSKENAFKAANIFLESLSINSYIDIPLITYQNLTTNIKSKLEGYQVSVEYKEKKILNPYLMGNYFGNKNIVISNSYLINSKKNRLSLLAGIIDSGCYYNNGIYKLKRKNKDLSNSIVYLARSLGFKVTIKLNHKINLYYITIRGSDLIEIPVRCKKNKSSIIKYNHIGTINIEKLGDNNYYGFTIDGNHRYLLGDFTVTHNTFTVLGLILRDKMLWDMNYLYAHEKTNSDSVGIITITTIERYDRLPTNLILVPPSVLKQWKNELKYTILRFTSITSAREIDNLNPSNFDVILVIPSMYNNLVTSFSRYAWKRFIFDEPGHIRVPNMKEIKAGFYWFITATPNLIVHKHQNCKNSLIFKIIGENCYNFEDCFKGIILKNPEEFVKLSYNMPPTQYIEHIYYQPVLQVISGLISNEISLMIDIGNIEEAIFKLGGKKTNNIIELVRNNKLNELKLINPNNKEQIQSINNDIAIIDNRFSDILHGNCNICLDILNKPVFEPNCQNLFCGICLLKWLQKNSGCPLCRNIIDPSKLIYITHELDTKEYYKSKHILTKNEILIDILHEKLEGKFLIFSTYNKTFRPICSLLKENNIIFAEIIGSISKKEKNLELFKSGKIQVLFLNSINNGAGINLNEATDIILYHEMNSSIQNQIIGRANRIGRTIPLTVHYFKFNI